MRGSPGTQTESKPELTLEPTGSAGLEWRTKWAAAEALPRLPGAPVGKIVAIVLVLVVAIAVTVFLLMGGPGRFASRNVQRAPITNIAVPTAMPALPAGGLEDFVPPIIPAPVPARP